MVREKFNVVIVGSGFAGIVAADILADYDLKVLLLDENIHVGGQLLRKIGGELGQYPSYRPDYVKRIGFKLVEGIRDKKLTVLNRTRVIGFYPGNEILVEVEEKEVRSLLYDVILFATGAREKFLPFKGWTLPGIYSTGLVQVLMKSSGILPSEKILIGGSGLFLFAVAYEFLRNRGRVAAVLQHTSMVDKIKFLPLLFRQFSKFLEGGKFLSRIFLSGVPVRHRRRIVEARGERCLEEVVAARTDPEGRLIGGSEKIYKIDALAVGYGFTPNIELPQMAKCDLEFSEAKGGWVVRVGDRLETTVKNVFAAGEITGVGGALKSMNEGQIAAYSILKRFGRGDESECDTELRKLTRERIRHLRFGEYFNLLYRVPPSSILDIPEDTVVCRCEDVKMGDIKRAVKNGYRTPGALKVAVRAAMGNCQGRTCAPVIYDVISTLTREDPEKTGPFSVRPPLKPVAIGSLANYRETYETGSGD